MPDERASAAAKLKKRVGPVVRGLAHRAGYDLVKSGPGLPPDFDEGMTTLLAQVEPYTITTAERVFALREAVRYVVRAGVPGAIVECGVWKGGSVLAAILELRGLGVDDRDIWLYDNFEGMPAASDRDVDISGNTGNELFGPGSEPEKILPAAPLDGVKALLASTRYPSDQIHFVVGDILETIPETVPEEIAILRLDTDWYESTHHELVHLYPLVADGGVVIIDDYGHWRGSREAVDEYWATHDLPVLLHRVDYTCRVGVVRRR